jgi:hypothetical protein
MLDPLLRPPSTLAETIPSRRKVTAERREKERREEKNH